MQRKLENAPYKNRKRNKAFPKKTTTQKGMLMSLPLKAKTMDKAVKMQLLQCFFCVYVCVLFKEECSWLFPVSLVGGAMVRGSKVGGQCLRGSQ